MRRAASRSGPCTITLPSIGSYAVLDYRPLDDSAASTRARGDQRDVRRDAGLRAGSPAQASSAYTRASMAWPSQRDVLLGERQRLARGDAQLQLHEVEGRSTRGTTPR